MIWAFIWLVLAGIALFGGDMNDFEDNPLRKICAFIAAAPVVLALVGLAVGYFISL